MEFINPWYMVWGGALISSPILIHLINRMRFKRIRWAAMEFLLKSQKRNRRRLIIEQMILLLLRILLVLLAGFLVARLISNVAGKADEGTTHVIILDDSLSMTDHGRAKNKDMTAFDRAREQVLVLARTLNKSPSPQRIQVKLLSELDRDLLKLQPVNDAALADLDRKLKVAKPTLLRLTSEPAFTTGHDLLARVTQGQKIFHFASDFREPDWTEPVQQKVAQMVKDGILVSFIDTATPFREKSQKVAPINENFAITDVSCESRVVPVDIEVEFKVTIKNYSQTEVNPFLTVKIDGFEDFRGAGPVGRIPGGQTLDKKFQLSFNKLKKGPPISAKDPLEERERKRRQDREFHRVSVELKAEQTGTGIRADNARDVVIEVRREVPFLVVDGNSAENQGDGSDVIALESALISAIGYYKAAEVFAVQRCNIQDLDHVDLSLYPIVFFLNVGEVKSTKALERLDTYVRNGGSLAYFMGTNVRPEFYNETLYRKYNRLFPVLLDKVASMIDPSGKMKVEEREEKRKDLLQNDPQPKILFRNPEHAVVKEAIYPYREHFRYVELDRYFRTKPRSEWEADGKDVDEIATLPKSREEGKSSYGGPAQELVRQALGQVQNIAKDEPDYKVYLKFLEDYVRVVGTAGSKPYLFDLIEACDRLLNDQGEKGNKERPNMPNLWAHPKMRSLGQQLKELIETMSYGDPLVVARRHGSKERGGRVVVVLTTAGNATGWNRWSDGSPASFTFSPFIINLERWLLGGNNQNSRTLGTPFELTLDAARYQPKLRWTYQPQNDMENEEKESKRSTPRKAEPAAEAAMKEKNKQLSWSFQPKDNLPGVLTVELLPVADVAGEQVIPETRAYAYNIDTQESELKRAKRDQLLKAVNDNTDSRAVVVRSPDDSFEAYKEKEPDVSESPWIYLLFILVLVVEQALAVHLSFHLKGSEAAPTAKPQPASEPATAA